MTLILGLAAPNGFWLSSDYRLTDPSTGKLVDDWSPKSITVRCSDGVAIMTYCGVGKIGNEHATRWLIRQLEGQRRSLYEAVMRVRDGATVAFKRLGWARSPMCKHLFIVAAFQWGEPWLAEITNLPPEGWRKDCLPVDHFYADARRIEKPNIIMAGIREAVQLEEDKELLRRARDVRPRHPAEFLRLLATINRRATSPGISKACETTWLSPPPSFIEKWSFTWGEPPPPGIRASVQAFRHVEQGVSTLSVTQALVARLPLPADPNEGIREDTDSAEDTDRDVAEKARWRQFLRDTRGERTDVAPFIVRGDAQVQVT
jgi:hypothetical protein